MKKHITLSDDELRLRTLSERITKTVSHVQGVVTAQEADEHEALRRKIRLDYDAVNRRWRSYGPMYGDGSRDTDWEITG